MFISVIDVLCQYLPFIVGKSIFTLCAIKPKKFFVKWGLPELLLFPVALLHHISHLFLHFIQSVLLGFKQKHTVTMSAFKFIQQETLSCYLSFFLLLTPSDGNGRKDG